MAKRIAGNQSADRHPQDAYPTDARWTSVLLERVTLEGPIWEPAAGDRAMVQVLADHGYEVIPTDIIEGHDFLTSTRRAPSIVTNPPYRILNEFAAQGLKQTDRFLCLLVGWHFLAGGSKRVDDLWLPFPPTRVIAIAERMRVNGSPSQFNHAWVVWDLWSNAPTTLEWAHA